jgi:hypothetical protein
VPQPLAGLDSSKPKAILSGHVVASAYPKIASQDISPRSWRASLIRKKAQVFGDVEAPSREAAEAAAVRTFNLSPEQRSRLVVPERR